MSYDLTVYSSAPLGQEGLAELLRSAGLDVKRPTAQGMDPGQLVIVRGKKSQYCFTLDGPFPLEDEDIPEEITAVILAPKFLYQVAVEGSDRTSIPSAVRFSKKLAEATTGAAYDIQTGDIWPRKSLRTPSKPAKNTQVRAVQIEWYYLVNEAPIDIPEIYCRLARKYLPEALPRRFGTYEPFAGNFERDGAEGVARMLREEPNGMLQFYGTYPVGLGFILGIDYNTRGDVSSVGLTMDCSVLQTNPGWLENLHRFFVHFARETHSFFSSAEVIRGFVYNGKTVSSRWESESPGRLQDLGKWSGLANYPQWWTWYSDIYSELALPHLTSRIEKYENGIFHAWDEKPLDRDAIQLLLGDPQKPWIPAEFSPTYNEHGHIMAVASNVPQRLAS
ncbi:hypothetical protein [Paenarthrobacter sp. AMU7]|uniref:Uncharacterized protein n=1 Tax=Paenarthrobacter sp. AMU7 TaxID=3162492 RepID=A0AB39YP58_9MICC